MLYFLYNSGAAIPTLIITNTSSTASVQLHDFYLTLGPSIVSSPIYRSYAQLPSLTDLLTKIASGEVTVTYTATAAEATDIPSYPSMDLGGGVTLASYANASEPSSPETGQLIWSSTDGTIRAYGGASWSSLLSGGAGFNSLTAGTNTNGAMLIGTGASLDTSGSGTIDATTLNGASFAATGTIGGTTPAGATFTTVVASTSLTDPLVIGGTGVGSDLTLQSTSGVGNGTDTVLIKVGNNGGTTSATFDAAGMQGAVGVTTPAAGAFTTLTASTSFTNPLVIGGSAVGSDLTLQSTSGVGDGTDLVLVKVGNNGGTTAATFDAGGINAIVGATTPAAATFTTVVASTSETTPKVIGGTAVGSDLTLQSTSGVGDGTDTILLKVGNNGGTTVATAGAASFAVTGAMSATTTATVPAVIGGTAVGSDLTLQSTSGVGDGTDTVLVKVGNNGGTTAATFDSAGMQGAVGVTTPAVGAFTTISAVTSLTDPLVIGGTAVGSDLTLQSTSGVGDGTDKVFVKVGNNGGTTSATFDSAGMQGAVGVTTPAAGSFTTLVASTSLTDPLVIGGTAVGSDLTLQSTSGVGDGTDTVLIKVGNNGATTVASAGAALFAITGAVTATTTATVPTVIGGSAVGSDLTLQSTSGIGDGSDSVLIKVGNNGATTVANATAASFAVTGAVSTTTTVTVGTSLLATPDAITATAGGVAASATSTVTEITTDGDVGLDNVTLAAGTNGQIKVFAVVAVGNAGDSVKITPASLIGGSIITFPASPLGLGCVMYYDAGAAGWIIVGNNGGTVS